MDKDGLKGWNHVPNLPLEVSPFFRWPLRPIRYGRMDLELVVSNY